MQRIVYKPQRQRGSQSREYLSYATLPLGNRHGQKQGYATFGDVTRSNLLMNYAETDGLAALGRLATFVSILFGFPLAMLACYPAFFHPEELAAWRQRLRRARSR